MEVEQAAYSKLILGNETFQILGACFEVYRQLGCGILESVYVECLKRELTSRAIPFAFQPKISLRYKGESIEQYFIPDFICFEKVILEIKATYALEGAHRAQIINYLRASTIDVGLLINFGHYPKIEHERFVSRRLLELEQQQSGHKERPDSG